MSIRLVVLDVNETLFSLQPVADRFRQVGLEGRFELWFTRILRDGFAAAAAGAPVAFEDLARHHLSVLLEQAGLDAGRGPVGEVIGGFDAVTAHPDVAEGLRALRDADLTTVTLTVGNAAITRRFLEREGLDDLVSQVHDASSVGHWKPSPRAYLQVLDIHRVPPEQAALVAVHPWDVAGAQRAGLVGAWLDRDGVRYPSPFPVPDVTAPTLPAAVAELVRR